MCYVDHRTRRDQVFSLQEHTGVVQMIQNRISHLETPNRGTDAVLGWARLWAAAEGQAAPTLRRGAWYPILHDRGPTSVILGTPKRNVRIPRHLLEIRPHRPERFTVVYRSADDPNPLRGTPADLGRTYAVCPQSRSRIRLSGHPERLECPTCGHAGGVAWWETG